MLGEHANVTTNKEGAMKLSLLIALLTTVLSAYAGCFGSGGIYTCTDSSGNVYNVNRFGGSTYMTGSNPRTGSNWSQTSHDLGNVTITNGTSAQNRPWNATTIDMGGGFTSTTGTDSRGRPFSATCGPFGCQ